MLDRGVRFLLPSGVEVKRPVTNLIQVSSYRVGKGYGTHTDIGANYDSRVVTCSILLAGDSDLTIGKLGAPVALRPGDGVCFDGWTAHGVRPASRPRVSLIAWATGVEAHPKRPSKGVG